MVDHLKLDGLLRLELLDRDLQSQLRLSVVSLEGASHVEICELLLL